MPAQHRFTGYTADWSQTLEVKPYPITVHIDADVVTPIADALPVYEVIPQRITQEQVDSFLSQFGEVTYHLNMDLKTKSDYEAMILEAQESIAQYNQRKDRTPEQKEEHKKSLEEGIEYFKQWMRGCARYGG